MIRAIGSDLTFRSTCIARLGKVSDDVPLDKVNQVAEKINKKYTLNAKNPKGDFLTVKMAPYNADGNRYLLFQDNNNDCAPLFDAIKSVFGENNAFRT